MNDGHTGYPWSTGDVLLAADLNAAIANAGAIGLSSVGVTFSVDFYGAKGDRQQYSGTLTVASGVNPTLSIAGATLSAVVPGQLVILPLGGAEGVGIKATVASVVGSQIALNGNVATPLAGIAFQASGNPTIATAGTGVSPLDVYTLAGGTFVVPAQIVVQTTKVNTVAINTAGSGGIDGTYTFVGTSPGAAQFQFTGTIAGGVLASVVATPTVAGKYQKNPLAIGAEPVTDVGGVSGLVNATVTLTMGANNVRIEGQTSSIAAVAVPGGYSATPSDPVSATGPGTGVTFNMTGCWVAPTVVIGTDNAPFINAASAALRALGVDAGSGRMAIDSKLVFSAGADYLVNDSLNFTEMSRCIIDGQRATIYSCATGLPVFDEMGSQNFNNISLSVTGDPTFPPRWAFQYGTVTPGQTARSIGLDDIIIAGTFSDAGLDYNFGTEVVSTGSVKGNFFAPYSRIEDACNSTLWNVTSKYVPNTMPRDTAQTFGGGSHGQITLTNNHWNGCGVWMLGGSNHNYQDGYIFAHQHAFLIIASGLTYTNGLKVSNTHIEGVRCVFFIQNMGAPHGNLVPQLPRLEYTDAGTFCTEAVFGLSDDIVHATLFNIKITVGFQSTNATYFSDPSRFVVSGIILGGDGAIQRWSANTPADMSGFTLLTGANTPELFTYNLEAQTDTLINGLLSVGDSVQVGDAVSVSDGTVASVRVTTGGRYANPDYPTIAIDPPLSGVRALATVTGMQWFGDPTIIAGGSGYSKGGVFTFVGGTHTTPAQGIIIGVDGAGKVTAIKGGSAGSYSAYPPVGATTTTGGGGTGLVIDAKVWGVKADGTGVTVTVAGSGYTNFPDVVFSAPLTGAAPARGSVVMGTAWYVDSTGAHSALPVSLPNGSVAVTPAPGDNDTSIATTAFVQAAAAVAGVGTFLPLTGGTVTGATTFNAGLNNSAPINIANLGSSTGLGFWQQASVTGTATIGSLIGFNQWNVNSDTAALTGQQIFHTAINYNYGGTGFVGSRGGLWINMMQTGVASGVPGQGGMVGLQAGVTANNTFGGTDTGPGASGGLFGGNLWPRLAAGAVNIRGICGLEIDVSAGIGSSYQSATGLAIVATSDHAVGGSWKSNYGINIAGQSNTLGFDAAYALNSWALSSNGVVFKAEFAGDRPTFPVAKGFDLRSMTFSADIFAASGFAVGPTGRVRVGTGFLDVTGTGAALSVDGAVVTAGTLTGAVTTAFASDGNSYYADDPYGGMWAITFPTGTSSITAITLKLAGVTKGTPPANPITLTPRGRLNMFQPGAITANLTWDTSKTALAIQASGGATTVGGSLSVANNLTASGSVIAPSGSFILGGLTGVATAVLGGPAGSSRTISFYTGSTSVPANLRWILYANATAEGGSNIGSDLQLGCYTDTGAGIINAVTVTRSTGQMTLLGGLSLGGFIASPATDLSKHLMLHSAGYGINVVAATLQFITSGVVGGNCSGSFLQGTTGLKAGDATHNQIVLTANAATSGNSTITLTGTGGLQFGTFPLGFNTATPIAKPTVSGAKGSNAALASLMTALAAYGLVTDSTTA